MGRDYEGLAAGLGYWNKGRFPIRGIEVTAHSSLAHIANLAMAGAMGGWLLLLGKGDRLLPAHIAKLLASLAESTLARCGTEGVQTIQSEKGHSLESWEWRLTPSSGQPLSYCPLPLSAVMFERMLFKEGYRFN